MQTTHFVIYPHSVLSREEVKSVLDYCRVAYIPGTTAVMVVGDADDIALLRARVSAPEYVISSLSKLRILTPAEIDVDAPLVDARQPGEEHDFSYVSDGARKAFK